MSQFFTVVGYITFVAGIFTRTSWMVSAGAFVVLNEKIDVLHNK